jgi:hypothetical protein
MEKRERHQVDGTIKSLEAKQWDYLQDVDFNWLSGIMTQEMTDNNAVH